MQVTNRRFSADKLLIASNNKGKIIEFEQLLLSYDVEVISAQLFDLAEPEETGMTFKENAELKARYYCKHTNLPALADDSGVVIDELGGEPGVYSARWAGENKNFAVAIKKVKDLLEEKSKHSSKASFICHLSLIWPDGHIENFEGKIDGIISFPPKGSNGFGYDSIFRANGYEETFAELDAEVKNKIRNIIGQE